MSSRELSCSEISVLSKGLKYTPTPKGNSSELAADVNEFCRKLRLNELFYDDEKSEEEGPLVRNKTGWQPPKSKDKQLEETISMIKNYPLETIQKPSNLTKDETLALKTLSSDKSIVIKEADKGGAVVIMDASYYRNAVLKMLEDEEFYSETNSSMDNQTRKMINKLVEEHEGCLYEEEADYLTNFKHNTSYFYGLPKIHKSTVIAEAVEQQNAEYIKVFQPSDLKFRPIVGGPNCPTQRLSHFLDIILKPICPEVQSFVRDDIDFLSHLPENTEEGTTLITFDVTSLYINIPHELGESAVRYWLNKCREKVKTRFTDEFIVKGLN